MLFIFSIEETDPSRPRVPVARLETALGAWGCPAAPDVQAHLRSALVTCLKTLVTNEATRFPRVRDVLAHTYAHSTHRRFKYTARSSAMGMDMQS